MDTGAYDCEFWSTAFRKACADGGQGQHRCAILDVPVQPALHSAPAGPTSAPANGLELLALGKRLDDVEGGAGGRETGAEGVFRLRVCLDLPGGLARRVRLQGLIHTLDQLSARHDPAEEMGSGCHLGIQHRDPVRERALPGLQAAGYRDAALAPGVAERQCPGRLLCGLGVDAGRLGRNHAQVGDTLQYHDTPPHIVQHGPLLVSRIEELEPRRGTSCS